VDVNDRINELIGLVESARAMPMSASCVVNRAQVLDLLQDLRKMLPEQLGDAEALLRERDAVIAEGRREADRIVASARDERGAMIANTDVARDATGEASRIREEALREAEQIRAEADDYVDQKLANFEVVLTKTLKAVGRGRDKMRGHNPMEELGRHVEEQDAADAERDYDRFGADLRRPDREYGDDRREVVDGSGSGEYEQFGETSEYHRIAEQPYEPRERRFGDQQAQPYAARTYGGGNEFADDGYGAPPEAPYAEPAYAEANGYAAPPAYPEPDAYPRTYGVPEQSNGHLPALPHQSNGDQSGGYAVPSYAPTTYGVSEYSNQAAGQPAAQDPYVTPADYPADGTSYFDTGLIDVRQFHSNYER
jgi:hypothetical protein